MEIGWRLDKAETNQSQISDSVRPWPESGTPGRGDKRTRMEHNRHPAVRPFCDLPEGMLKQKKY